LSGERRLSRGVKSSNQRGGSSGSEPTSRKKLLADLINKRRSTPNEDIVPAAAGKEAYPMRCKIIALPGCPEA